jgi:hypothetical protein
MGTKLRREQYSKVVVVNSNSMPCPPAAICWIRLVRESVSDCLTWLAWPDYM